VRPIRLRIRFRRTTRAVGGARHAPLGSRSLTLMPTREAVGSFGVRHLSELAGIHRLLRTKVAAASTKVTSGQEFLPLRVPA